MKIEFAHHLQHFANTTGLHWKPKAGAARRLRHLVAWQLVPLGKQRPAFPCKVVMTRLAPREFDDDNLVHAFKHIRDQIAVWLGVDDKRDPRVTYVCEQQKTGPGQYFVRIEFVPLAPLAMANESSGPQDIEDEIA